MTASSLLKRLSPWIQALRTRLFPWIWSYRARLLLLFVCVLGPLALFGELAEDVLEQEPFSFDEPILLSMRALASPELDRVMLFMSLVGFRYGVVPAAAVVWLALLWRRKWGNVLFWTVALGGAALLNMTAKAYFARVRPQLWLSLAPETTYSFPSGHAMGSMALAAAVLVLTWPTRWRWPALILGSLFVFMVGLSRVYLGVHYPSDILAGWAASLAWVAGASMIFYGRPTKPTPTAEPDQTP